MQCDALISIIHHVSLPVAMTTQYLMSYLQNDDGELFGFPISLTLWHMVFSSACASALVWSGLVKGVEISTEVYVKYVIPISGCYALALVLSNTAYQVGRAPSSNPRTDQVCNFALNSGRE